MATVWSTEQVLALAPDAGSAKSGKELATPRKWVSLGTTEHVLWGECQGSGASPYQTKVALDEPAYHCSCPSRKFPCKHALGLLLLSVSQPGAVPAAEPPAWVASWLDARAQRADQKAKKEQERQEKREKGEPVVDAPAQQRREAARWAKVTAGVNDLGLWIGDLVRQGLSGLQGKPSGLWDEQARRLIDAQAPGLARRLRQLEAIPLSGDGWQDPVLDRLARLHLAVEGCRRFDALGADLRDELRALLGLPVDQDSVRSGPGVRDVWQVVGQRVEVEDRLRTQRTWLVGRETGRAALVLDFAYGSNQPLDATLPAGMQIDAELAFFPGVAPLRALVKARSAPGEPLTAPRGHTAIREAHAAYASLLAQNPWVEAYPLVLRDVLLVPRNDAWQVRDATGYVLPLSSRFARGWQLLGLSGGGPLTLAGEYDGAVLEPVAGWLQGRYFRITADASEAASATWPRLDAPGELADLWREAAASALVGTERRPPPSVAGMVPYCDSAARLETADSPGRLLGLSACLTQYLRVGFEPAVDQAAPPAPCPPEDRPECTPPQAERLGRMLAGEHASALEEWMTLAAAAGRRIANVWLADALALGRWQSDVREPLRQTLGNRGEWLAGLNPEWAYVGGQAASADPQAVWDTGTRPERLAALRALRLVDAARGRALLASTWGSETADDRAAFVQALAAGLGADDEPFLEAALDDRGKSVRREAAELLARLPESAFARRMSERAAALLRWDGAGLLVDPPSACDASMVRDGIVEKPPAGVGARAWWLRQLVAASPLSAWEPAVRSRLSEFLAAAMATEWAQDLWSSLSRATLRAGDVAWATGLLHHRPLALPEQELIRGLLTVLAPRDRDAYLLQRIETQPDRLNSDHPVWPLIANLDKPIGDDLAHTLLRELQVAVADDESRAPRPRYDYQVAHFLVRLAGLLPVSLASEIDHYWPRSQSEGTFYASAVEQMKSVLQFRHAMHQEFAR